MRHFFALCDKFGVPIAEKKTEGPVSVLTCFGLDIDAAAQSVKVPVDKLASLQAQLWEAAAQNKITLRQLQALIGSLNFVCIKPWPRAELSCGASLT